MTLELLAGLLAAGIRLSIPIALAAVGEATSQRSGVINVGIEGIMLVGAFLSAYGAAATGSPWAGAGLGMLGGCLLAAVHGYFTIRLRADQIVSGIALVILGLGLSGFLNRITLGRTPTAIPVLPPVDLGSLGSLPLVGPMLFKQNALAYLAIGLAIGAALVLRRTRLGLAIRACGESPEAANAAGIGVRATRFGCVVFGGGMAGLAGAYLVLGQVNAFVENMVAGRGFIAIACVVFARWNPAGAVAVAVCFGILEALQIRLQIDYPEVPYQFFVIVPYLAAIAALALLARSAGLPAALGRPYP